MNKQTYRTIQKLNKELENAGGDFLAQNGWRYTCQTPGCWWLWEKVLPDGRTLLAHQDTAIELQNSIDMMPTNGAE